jgi:hypothetical protein
MKKLDLLYKNLLELLSNLSLDSPEFSDYHDALAEPFREEIITLVEKISRERTEISKSQLRKEFHSDFTDIIEYLDDFKSKFGNYPNFRKNEIYAIISIVQKLYTEFNDSIIDLEEEVDVSIFNLMKVDDVISQNNFLHFDSTTIENSLLLVNINEKEKFKLFIDETVVGTHLLFFLLGKIGVSDHKLDDSKYILVKAGLEAKPKMVWATLCLYIVKSGKIIHEPHEYNLLPSITSDCSINLGETYQQFADSIDIISEYNYQKDILDKYLRIYHVIENFMFKRPLVDIEKQSDGDVFSIRDFKRMYDSVNDSELKTLKKLTEKILELDYNSTTTFEAKTLSDWQSLAATYFGGDETKIDSLISIFNIRTKSGNLLKYSEISASNINNLLSSLIYSFRNSMVHNRETEFHLTHLTLNNHDVIGDTARKLLEKYLLPIMEEMCFFLIIKRNDLVWYDNSSLKLWNEN